MLTAKEIAPGWIPFSLLNRGNRTAFRATRHFPSDEWSQISE